MGRFSSGRAVVGWGIEGGGPGGGPGGGAPHRSSAEGGWEGLSHGDQTATNTIANARWNATATASGRAQRERSSGKNAPPNRHWRASPFQPRELQYKCYQTVRSVKSIGWLFWKGAAANGASGAH